MTIMLIVTRLLRSPAPWASDAWLERLRQRRALLRLPDAMLKDIGISRCDVWREARKPFWQA